MKYSVRKQLPWPAAVFRTNVSDRGLLSARTAEAFKDEYERQKRWTNGYRKRIGS